MKLCKRASDGSFPSTCRSAPCRGAPVAEFDTARLCTPVGVMLERRGNYRFVLEQDGEWSFLGARSGPGGMPLRAFLPNSLQDSAAALGRFVLLAAAYPLKRTLDRPFGHVITRYGETGNEENFIDGEPQAEGRRLDETFRATRNGQMFVYLNQPVNGVFTDLFPNVNSGKARIWVYRIPR